MGPLRRLFSCFARLGALALVLVAPSAAAAASDDTRRLAIVVAAPWGSEPAMHNDVVALQRVLKQRGFAPAQMLVLDGPITRRPLLALLDTARRRIAGWSTGDVWLSVSGHGAYTGLTPRDARAVLALSSDPPSREHRVSWDEMFAALHAPPGVRVTVLPDT